VNDVSRFFFRHFRHLRERDGREETKKKTDEEEPLSTAFDDVQE
jgi:hypothetical protein